VFHDEQDLDNSICKYAQNTEGNACQGKKEALNLTLHWP
jgi:hypothetical protein